MDGWLAGWFLLGTYIYIYIYYHSLKGDFVVKKDRKIDEEVKN